MTVFDLLFLASVLFIAALTVRMFALIIRRRWASLRRTAVLAAAFVACYSGVLVVSSLVRPRRVVAAGERRCFDDWCVAALTLERAASAVYPGPSGQWVATVEVSSRARRVRQRARDAWAELEDLHGIRYPPCGVVGGSRLSDALNPGESFRVELPYTLPTGAQAAGLVIHHGAFPGVIIIGEDQSFLHPRASMRVALRN
jgi:hypothetical protein